MAADKIISLSEDDVRIIQCIIDDYKRRVVNTRLRPRVEEADPQSPEVYVALTPGSGIPAMTTVPGTGTDIETVPGSAECDIYRRGFDDGELEPAGFTRTVYNFSSSPVAAVLYIAVNRDKYGTWYAQTGTSSGGGSSPLTTLGDIWGYSTVDDRIPVGTDGQILTADSTQGLGVRWAGFSGAQVNISTNYAGGGATSGRVPWDTEVYDTDNYWTIGNGDRLTVPKTGWYEIYANIIWNFAAGSAPSSAAFVVTKNNSTSPMDFQFFTSSKPEDTGSGIRAGSRSSIAVYTINKLIAGDFVSVDTSNSPGAVSVLGGTNPFLSMFGIAFRGGD